MQKDAQNRSTASAAGVFAITFVGCTIVLPAVGLALGVLGPASLNWVAATVCIPVFAFWIGDLWFGQGPDARLVLNADGYHAIPLVVWLVTWMGFAWAASGLGVWSRVGTAVGVIAAVTVGMHVVLRLMGIQFIIPNL